MIVYSETNQYLKRTYHIKNSAGRNQIYDRIRMLAEFYEGAVMLKYQHPMMVISKTKDVFLKRIKRMKKMIASDCSSQQSSSHKSQNSSIAKSFSNSNFLKTVKSSDIDSSGRSKDSLIQNCKKTQKLYDLQLHDIYNFQILEPNCPQINLDHTNIKKTLVQNKKSQKDVQHLIIDLDQIDKQRVVRQYKKVQERQQQNIPQPKQSKSKRQKQKQKNIKKSSIIITALDSYTPQEKQSQSSQANAYNYYPKNTKNNMKRHPAGYRYKQEYDETIRLNNYASNNNLGSVRQNYGSRNAVFMKQQQNPNYRSPSFGSQNYFDEGNQTARNTFQQMAQPLPTTTINSNQRYQRQNQKQYEKNEPMHIPPLYPPQQQQKRYTRDRIYTQNPYLRQNQSPASGSVLLNIPSQNQTLYITHQNSQTSSHHNNNNQKINKKQFVRQKAVALLHKVKSEQKLPIYIQHQQYQQDESNNMYKYHSRHRIASNTNTNNNNRYQYNE